VVVLRMTETLHRAVAVRRDDRSAEPLG
jgi:hypothetical protein